ncbi:MAG TPA: hypothetical protein VJ763_05970 [Sphingomicrobium sp.]|nr:hypothetical protein [Sphingomicrobium sp.]
MNARLLPPIAALMIAAPAQATGGFQCRTAGPEPIEASVGFGHVPGARLIATRLIEKGRVVPVRPAQWWLDRSELRLLLIGEDALREELVIRARRNGHAYDGSLWRNGTRRWVRCRED